MLQASELYQFINHNVTVTLSDFKAAELNLADPNIAGKVVDVSDKGIVLSAKNAAIILSRQDILNLRFRRQRVVSRMVRIFGRQDDVRQHLADRHGTWISLLRTLNPEAALRYHEKIDHKDLGHQHSNKVGTRAVNEDVANRTINQLDEIE